MTCDIDGDGRTELIFFRRDEGVFDMTGLEAIEAVAHCLGRLVISRP